MKYIEINKIIQGDVLGVLKTLPNEFVDCMITSPPYWGLRDYGTATWEDGDEKCDHATSRSRGEDIKIGDKQRTSEGSRPNIQTECKCGAKRIDAQLGLEKTPEEYVANLVEVFGEIKRVLKKEGIAWLNLGDSYAGNNSRTSSGRAGMGNEREGIFEKTGEGLKSKDLVGIPWRVAFALQADGWWLRQDAIWSKPNPMPESVQGSHFYRHCVTVKEYEELQRVWPTKSANKNRPGDLFNLPSRKISDSEAALSKEPKGNSDSESKRATPRGEGKKKQILSNIKGQIKQQKIPINSERESVSEKAFGELQSTTPKSRRNSNSPGLDGHSGPPSLSLFLLQKEKFQNDSRPCNSIKQGRQKLARKYSASVSKVQLHKERQNRMDSKEKIDCPGCYRCENQNGFIFTLSAGRCTKSHEYIFLLTKSAKYYFDNEAIKENSVDPESYTGRRFRRAKAIVAANARPGSPNTLDKGNEADGKTYEKRNKRSVWTITTKPYKEAHFATFPQKLIEPMIKAGSPKGGLVLDPFMGSGTTAYVARQLNRNYLGIELNPDYIKIAEKRLAQQTLL